jgi:hypothetical protein
MTEGRAARLCVTPLILAIAEPFNDSPTPTVQSPSDADPPAVTEPQQIPAAGGFAPC